ncbi:DNA-directed RNA polymerase I subunit (Rpa190), putative [Talaromyces stipitatus ATCC 10500]|uniref:DNA-directed RNA polymerase subunit n=1 Tax=Talaromyces stipitatus (strain ATCC 10500 / CBS 375.48 / QM 6759 / NRRL 1006) TaxID=441959 RepID=B8M0T3_TALSN|nr:DNA-directed RNA polymerase I subunit (Rpa190), putative [Talaromyces stipitatus ATCC 10500]EED21466.1 DNA-directed RNA polymerase I subunit (Rpa190), putative [Talaromyces stipitatus ATCC 10500]
MSSFARPVASELAAVDFSVYSSEDIKKISVKRIFNTPSLDSLHNPIPNSLYDPALGAWGDHVCTTCRASSWSCPGHPGHIELPVPIWNVTFFDQMYRLLRAKCDFCHRLRIARVEINAYACKLRLLQYGLVDQTAEIDKIGEYGQDAAVDADENGNVDPQTKMELRNKFVRKCIREAQKQGDSGAFFGGAKNPVAAEQRRELIKEFFKELAKGKICKSCHYVSPGYRKDRYAKIFRKAMSTKDKVAMTMAGMTAPNPVIVLEEEKKLLNKPKEQDKQNGTAIREVTELHGAEEEVVRANAAISQGSIAGGQEGGQQFVSSPEVYAAICLLFEKEKEILNLVYSSRLGFKISPDMLFVRNILVPPNRFRPPAQQGGQIMEAQQNTPFTQILKTCDLINMISHSRQTAETEGTRMREYRDLLQAIVTLQEQVNTLIDSDRGPGGMAAARQANGVKQLLEKKEGLFRKNMMGKRVNYAARSVISPDPSLETHEVGVPMVFAKKLTFPEPVTSFNFHELREAVINGPDKYPGASAIENESGQVVNLKFKTLDERTALANQLLAPSHAKMKGNRNKKVYRHLTTGDYVIMNRQPTLHKPSMMGHRARVLPNERVLRLPYPNTNSYNADYDGDEMNMHFPQNTIARAELSMITDADRQYISSTDGKPLRGLIQDHITVSTFLTSRDTFFEEDEYQQLLYSCLRPENANTVTDRIQLVEPAFIRPRRLWTGKQVISTVLKNIMPPNRRGLNLQGKSSTPGERWGKDNEEDSVIFKDGELLCGILDKKQIGASGGGFIDAIHEIYGNAIAGSLLSILGRLLTRFLNMRAFSCGIEDLRLTPEGDRKRVDILEKAATLGRNVSLKYVTLDQNPAADQDAELRRRLEDVLRDDQKQSGLDSVYNSQTRKLTSDIAASCLPHGLIKQFPWNQMQLMTTTGAKGSSVNANLISCNLGQQVLEGRRVPVMVSGKTLPSYRAFETHPQAGGYVCGRFLTGIKPQEYYFHTMAGREGLIDTAVKTAKSGYLQRCLIKGMEAVKVEYDSSVRDTANGGSVIQFIYGEDGLDVGKQVHLQNFSFLANNYVSTMAQLNMTQDFHALEKPEVLQWHKDAMKQVRKTGRLDAKDPTLAVYQPGGHYGSVSEAFSLALKKYEERNPDKLLKDKKAGITGALSKKAFESVMHMKYLNSVIDPGDAVGIVAGQSIGSQTTQMTLNTFHLAGHSARNVTLGVPRLREIVMTASKKPMTPTMTVEVIEELSEKAGQSFAKGISRLSIAEVIDTLQVRESTTSGKGVKAKIYDIDMKFFDAKEYFEEYAITKRDLVRALQDEFIPKFIKKIRAELKKREDEKDLKGVSAAQPEIGVSIGTTEYFDGAVRETQAGGADNDDDAVDEDNEDDEEDAKRAQSKQNRDNQVSYEAPDDDEDRIRREQDESDMEDDDEDNGSKLRQEKISDDGESDSSDESNDEDGSADQARLDRQDARMRAEEITGKFDEISVFKFNSKDGNSCFIRLEYSVDTPKLLVLPLVEDAARRAVIQAVQDLGSCLYTPPDKEKNEPAKIDIEGVNLKAMRGYQDYINPHTIRTNSIHDMLIFYGVEAARSTIIREMSDVFSGHSITVDNRHLNLIGDVMTHSGGFKSYSRNGLIKESNSPFSKSSFETSVGFMRDAVLERDFDDLKSPSSRIVVGRLGNVGTGAFDILAPVA